jgi:seryl-tRNA synthetase
MGSMPQRPPELVSEMRQIGDRIKELDSETRALGQELNGLLLTLPNILHPSVPMGLDEQGSIIVRRWGTRREFDFTPKPHWELGEGLGFMDFSRAVKLSGSRFYLLKGAGAKLERALIDWMIEVHVQTHGYTEIAPPYLVRREAMVGTGQLPRLGEDMYYCEVDDLFLIPTAEVPLTNLHGGEVLSSAELPLKYVGFTPCFRREAGAGGRDVRGILRVHQFDKVELVKLAEPQTSYDELEKLVADASRLLELLDIPYQVRLMSSGDTGFAAAKKYDIEAWFPGQDRYIEISSCSNFEEFQARRANIRYRPRSGSALEYVHTINGSGLAVGRTMAALLESYQQRGGSVAMPEVLRPYARMEAIG